MSLLLKAFPHGRPLPHARTDHRNNRPVLATVVVSVIALLAVLLPLAGPAEAKRPKPDKQRDHATHKAAQEARAQEGAQEGRAQEARAQEGAPGGGSASAPLRGAPTSYFSFPNRSRAEGVAIRKRGCSPLQSTWGGGRTRAGTPRQTNGTIRIATWSFDDWEIAQALVAARKRGVSVQIVAAKTANGGPRCLALAARPSRSAALPSRLPDDQRDVVSFARECRGACRGPGGTPHSKYFLFDNVGPARAQVTFQTS